ncbi:hypothetical protein DL991_10350 [Amycolatopsis sp. WAC 01375]|uniref:hypothetical protein n=1 Tax=Amycolatopsis sp. WAC 01375 TaxID=2203194 RepID=UPI000F7AD48D|nr:hypothetical protein [Amycolatopsis sp. WAC 01375]RSM80511.1 hypothetical protein DL991_10350 [Amycolatopsis sp. WAC 01375]
MTYVLTQAFTDEVTTRLDSYDRAALQADSASLQQLAQGVPILTGALRALLDQHQIDTNGDCAACPRPQWRRRARCQLPRELSVLLTDLSNIDHATGRHALRPTS